MRPFFPSLMQSLRLFAAAAAVALLLAVLWAWSGAYSVAASRGHWPIVEWLLTFVMRNSVETHAWGIDAPPLDRRSQILLGAGHFHSECVTCHGAPGFERDAVPLQMLPPPPDLSDVSLHWKDRELFWIVLNGIKYTGMPAWPALEREDEVWSVVAFLKQLPRLDAQQYREMVFGTSTPNAQSGRELARGGMAEQSFRACAICHGMDGTGPASALVPVLHGQSSEYLLAALRSYADGTRQSGIMQPVAAELSESAMKGVAEYYARLPAPKREPKPFVPEAIQRGQRIAESGLPDAELPGCLECHGGKALATFPRLAGQNAEYMETKLTLWKNGLAPRSAGAEIMAPIARRLTEQQIIDLAAYFASLSRAGADEKKP